MVKVMFIIAFITLLALVIFIISIKKLLTSYKSHCEKLEETLDESMEINKKFSDLLDDAMRMLKEYNVVTSEISTDLEIVFPKFEEPVRTIEDKEG